jgi:major intracellular serine protease
MSKEIYVALLDSGCRFKTYEKFSIKANKKGICKISEIEDIKFEHGNIIGEIINDTNIHIYDIQVFNEQLSTSPIEVYYALNYLLDKKVDVINMSLGFKENYKEIKEVCEKLIKKGVTIVCSYPRKSSISIYPASYEDVIKVTSEGMCKDDKVVALYPNKLFFGANPFSKNKEVAGSSVAVAKFTKEYCKYLKKGYSKEEILEEFSKRRVHEPIKHR